MSKSYLNADGRARKPLLEVSRHGDCFDGVDFEIEGAFLGAEETVRLVNKQNRERKKHIVDGNTHLLIII